MIDPRYAPKMAMHNRNTLKDKCGCYHCAKIFTIQDITEWTDNNDTALCPFCNVDSVISEEKDFTLNEDLLKKLNQYWF